MNERQPERFALMLPVYDTVADDPQMLAKVLEHATGQDWVDAVRRRGGKPHESPIEVEYIDNPHYLMEKSYIDEDGVEQTFIDHVKFTMYLKGWAVRL